MRVINFTADKHKLAIDVYEPNNSNNKAVILYFGGAWSSGDNKQFSKQALILNEHGYTVYLPEYRIREKHNTTPFDSVNDAIIAYNVILNDLKKNNIHEYYLGGGSSGAHLCLMASITTDIYPQGYLLFNPCVDMSMPAIYNVLSDYGLKISPIHLLNKPSADMLIIHGTKDDMISLSYSEKFKLKVEELGNKVVLKTYEGQNHGFFNYFDGNNIYFTKTINDTLEFLKSK